MAKLKVFRAASGFHDSYVAVPSRAAALRAWGANTDLFAMGAAEEVTDPELTAEALAKPGTIFKRKRGSSGGTMIEKTRSKPAKPSKAPLDRSERKLADTKAAQERERKAIEADIARLEEKKRKLALRHERQLRTAEAVRDKAADAYDAALERWKSSA